MSCCHCLTEVLKQVGFVQSFLPSSHLDEDNAEVQEFGCGASLCKEVGLGFRV